MRGGRFFKEGQVYAALFSDGWIKVGRGRNASKRIGCHVSASKMRGAKLVKSIISGDLLDTASAEKRLIDYCVRICTEKHGGEWFKGVCIEKVSAIILEEFSGDDKEKIRKTISDQHDNALKLLNYKFFDRNRNYNPSEHDEKWALSMSHASVMDTMYGGWMYGGDLFESIDGAPSKFQLFSALALYSMSTEEMADTYVTITDDPDEGIDFLMSAADSSARAILRDSKREPEKGLSVGVVA